jgi:hypothetical protein
MKQPLKTNKLYKQVNISCGFETNVLSIVYFVWNFYNGFTSECCKPKLKSIILIKF